MKKLNKKEDATKRTSNNYPMDSHKKFCARCYTKNHGCPSTGSKHKSATCSL